MSYLYPFLGYYMLCALAFVLSANDLIYEVLASLRRPRRLHNPSMLCGVGAPEEKKKLGRPQTPAFAVGHRYEQKKKQSFYVASLFESAGSIVAVGYYVCVARPYR